MTVAGAAAAFIALRRSWRLATIAFALALLMLAPIVACDEAGGEKPPPTATEQATASPTPTPTPALAVTPTPAATPATEGGQAPNECLTSERAYVDPDGRFAFCYPADMELVTVDTGEGIAPTVRHPITNVNQLEPNTASVTFVWQSQRHSITGDPCTDSPFLIQNRRIENFSIGGRSVDACLQDHYDRDDAGNPTVLLYKTLEMEVPAASGFLEVYAAYTGPGFVRQGIALELIAGRILHSAIIY